MNKKILKALSLGAIAGTTGVVSACSIKPYKTYDFGFAYMPINSLNYLKYSAASSFVGSMTPNLLNSALQNNDPNEKFISHSNQTYYKDDLSQLKSREEGLKFESVYALPLEIKRKWKGETVIATTAEMWNSYYNNQNDDGALLGKKPDGTSNIPPGGTPGKVSKFIESSQIYSSGMSIAINRANKWENGDNLSASDFIDYLNYILDIGNGSQLAKEFENGFIKGVSEYLDAQRNYYVKYKKIYSNPAGYTNKVNADGTKFREWKSENPGDDALIKDIEETYYGVGLYGDKYSSRPKNAEAKTWELLSTTYAGTNYKTYKYPKEVDSSSGDETPNEVELERQLNQDFINTYQKNYTSLTPTEAKEMAKDSILNIRSKKKLSALDWNMIFTPRLNIKPINRKFVESIGGFEKFGISKKNFLSIGPYKLDDIIFGAQGNCVMVKNESFIWHEDVLANKVKAYFTANPITESVMFDDGVIASTMIPNIRTSEYFEKEQYREWMSKLSGYGTEGFAFNIAKTTEAEKKVNPVYYPSFRKMVYYSIDRLEMIRTMGNDKTNVKNIWTDLLGFDHTYNMNMQYANISNNPNLGGVVTDKDHPNLNVSLASQPFENKTYVPYDGSKEELPQLINGDLKTLTGVDSIYESMDRTDKVHSNEIATHFWNEFLQDWKDKNGTDFNHYELRYIYGNGELGSNTGVVLQNAIRGIVGNKVTVDIHGFPSNVFEQKQSTGDWDIIYKPFQNLSTSVAGYTISLVYNDSPRPDSLLGFYENPTGGWNFYDAMESLSATEKADVIKRFHISNNDWDAMMQLTSYTTYEKTLPTAAKEKERKARLEDFFDGLDHKQGNVADVNFVNKLQLYRRPGLISNLIIQFEKIIKEFAPVIPVTTLGNKFFISASAGGTVFPSSLVWLPYMYDRRNPPKAGLTN